MTDRPLARSEGVVSEHAGDGLVVYDERSSTAHSLSAAAAAVWALCNGQRSPAELAEVSGFEPGLVVRAIDELSSWALLDEGPAVADRFLSRRQAAKRLAQVGGAAFAAPMIYSVAIGPAMAAASTCVANNGTATKCTTTADNTTGTSTGAGHCCSGLCFENDIGTKTCSASGCILNAATGCTGTGQGTCCDPLSTCTAGKCVAP